LTSFDLVKPESHQGQAFVTGRREIHAIRWQLLPAAKSAAFEVANWRVGHIFSFCKKLLPLVGLSRIKSN
jgi:hypothetical protein